MGGGVVVMCVFSCMPLCAPHQHILVVYGCYNGIYGYHQIQADTSGRVSSRASATECAFTSVNSSMTVNTVDSIDPTTVDGVTWEVCSGNYSKSNMEDGSYLYVGCCAVVAVVLWLFSQQQCTHVYSTHHTC